MASRVRISCRPASLEESPLRLHRYEPAFPSTLPMAATKRFSPEAIQRRLSFGGLSSPPARATSENDVRRHVTDFAPFDLWNNELQEFSSLSSDQRKWIYDTFPECNGIRDMRPFLVLRCPSPPKVICYTIGGRPTLFRNTFDDASINVLSRCVIGDPRIKVDIRKDLFSRCLHPTEADINQIMRAVDFSASRVHFYSGALIFEIGGESIVPSMLPGRIGGLPCLYVPALSGLFKKEERSSRLVVPGVGITDDSIYSPLRPGVRITSGDGRKSTSLGVLLRNRTGDMFLTVANHGFEDSDTVCHPLFETTVGKIVKRFVDSDMALVKMAEGVKYHTNDYFSVVPPRRLIPMEELKMYDFVMCDGYSCGGKTFIILGFTFEPVRGIPGEYIRMDSYNETSCIVFSMSTPGSDDLFDGMCGCPVVKEEDFSVESFVSGMIGSFRFSDGHHCFVPRLDPALERDFVLVSFTDRTKDVQPEHI